LDRLTVNIDALLDFETEIKLHINQKLFEKGAITQEMYTKAKDLILKGAVREMVA